MRTISFIWITALWSLCLPALAEDIDFAGGNATLDWTSDAQFVTIEARLNTQTPDVESHVWILTVDSHRFADGLFAWQLHYSESMDSVIVLPNDFLTVRNFTTAQLGIEAWLSNTGHELHVRIPVYGPIPHLIAAGDQIELHALWIQQAPLLASMVPDLTEITAATPAGGGAAIPETQIGASSGVAGSISTSLVPEVRTYVQGESISHRFVLEDPDIPAEANRIVLSFTLMRVHDGQASEFVRFAHIPFDSEIETYAYSIDTATLTPGIYRLLIDSANSSLSARMDVEIAASGK